MTYFHMATCHTIIGAKRFHFRVRDGIGWFTLAMFTKQTGLVDSFTALAYLHCCILCFLARVDLHLGSILLKPLWKSAFIYRSFVWLSLLSQLLSSSLTLTAPKRIGCYMVKPHGQLVIVSFTHYCASTPILSTS